MSDLLTDALGSVVAAFSNTKGAAALSDNQVYGPYGNLLYNANGSMGTAKGYTGQYSDPLTGLDYYVSRYYDPVAGIFLSADTKEGNAQGMNPYAYVAENPETLTDPSGQMIVCPPGGCGGGGGGNPTPPPPAPPDHGPTCGPDPSSCDGGGGSHQPTPPHGKTVKLQECNVSCGSYDLQLIQQHHDLVTQLWTDVTIGIGYILSLLADWALDQLAGIILDAASLVAQAIFVVHDIAALSGNVPQWLNVLVHVGQYLVGALNVAKGFVTLFGGIGALLDSFDFAKGIFTLAKSDLSDYLQSAISGIFGGGAEFAIGYNGLLGDNLSSLTPQELHAQCLAEHLSGCK